jgi:DNA polymerase/3'-5' exonuclease PolX
MNQQIISILDEYIRLKNSVIINSKLSQDDIRKEKFKIAALSRGVKAIKQHKSEITNKKIAKSIKGIGDGIANRIEEILLTSKLKELDDLKNEINNDSNISIITDLMSITGIGEVHARDFVNKGIKSVSDLKEKNINKQINVTHHVEMGMKYYDDFKLRIPYKTIETINIKLNNILNNALKEYNLEFIICGSYRRKCSDSGDIDILLTCKDIINNDDLKNHIVNVQRNNNNNHNNNNNNNYLQMIVDKLKKDKFIVDDLTSKGHTKYMGVCDSNDGHFRRIDILFIKYESYPSAMLYFTGSKNLNTLMRNKAIDLNMLLNEEGLYKKNKDGSKIKINGINSEKDIFSHLNMEYLDPENRCI